MPNGFEYSCIYGMHPRFIASTSEGFMATDPRITVDPYTSTSGETMGARCENISNSIGHDFAHKYRLNILPQRMLPCVDHRQCEHVQPVKQTHQEQHPANANDRPLELLGVHRLLPALVRLPLDHEQDVCAKDHVVRKVHQHEVALAGTWVCTEMWLPGVST